MSKRRELVFVYNISSGVFTRFFYLFRASPCPLYNLTHGLSGRNAQWQRFLTRMPVKNSFLHKDEFQEQITKLELVFPIIFLREQGRLQTLMTAKEIENCKDTIQLINVIDRKLKSHLDQDE